jgi:hypothetical protein
MADTYTIVINSNRDWLAIPEPAGDEDVAYIATGATEADLEEFHSNENICFNWAVSRPHRVITAADGTAAPAEKNEEVDQLS